MLSTTAFQHLEDVLPAWREKIQPMLQDLGSGIITLGKEPPEHNRLDESRHLAEVVTPVCLAWLVEQGYWPNESADIAVVQNEVQSAVLQLPLPRSESVEETEIPPGRWAFPAAIGAGIGAMLLSPMTWLSLGDRQIGLLFGAILGAFALVSVLALLSKNPKLYSAVQRAVLAGAGLFALGGLWQTFRGRATGWFRGSLYFAGAWLVMSMLRPKRRVFTPAEIQRRNQFEQNQQLIHGADMVLAFSWSHPERLPAGNSVAPSDKSLAPFICNLLSDLHAELISGRPLADLRDSVEALFQQFQDDGYEWRTIPKESPFDESWREDFETYGLIKPGEKVYSRRAALLRNGKLLQKGELRRARQDERV